MVDRRTPPAGIPESELKFEFIRASGPGGQNVNKVATAVRLSFDAAHSPLLGAEARARLYALAGRRINAEGILSLVAQRFRTQEANRRDAVARLEELLARARERPVPRRPTRPSAASVQRRIAGKRRRGAAKASRRARPGPDD